MHTIVDRSVAIAVGPTVMRHSLAQWATMAGAARVFTCGTLARLEQMLDGPGSHFDTVILASRLPDGSCSALVRRFADKRVIVLCHHTSEAANLPRETATLTMPITFRDLERAARGQ